jgi:hypothetical protein
VLKPIKIGTQAAEEIAARVGSFGFEKLVATPIHAF